MSRPSLAKTRSHVAQIRRLRKMRWSDASIARYIGVTRSAVYHLARTYNIPKAEGVINRRKRPCEIYVPKIDAAKAAAITEAKRAFWQNGGHLSTWVHPYARRSHGAQPKASTVPQQSNTSTSRVA